MTPQDADDWADAHRQYRLHHDSMLKSKDGSEARRVAYHLADIAETRRDQIGNRIRFSAMHPVPRKF